VVLVAGVFTTIKMLKSKTGSVNWDTVIVQRGNLKVAITSTGQLEAVKAVQVGTQVSGVISKIYVDFNSKVKKGQVIARLDTRTLKSSVDQAKADLDKAKIQLRQAERDYNRNKSLFEQKVLAQSDFDISLDNYETAKTGVANAQVAYDRTLINLNYATITAPIDGVVVSRNIDEGQTVAASFNTPTLFQIDTSLTKMQIQANVDEADIGQVRVGQHTIFTVDAFPNDTFQGKVSQIRLQPAVVNNVVTYTVIIDVQNPDMKLMPGMTANLTVYVEDRENVLKVPSRAFTYTPSSEIMKKYGKIPDNVKKRMASNQMGQGQGQGGGMGAQANKKPANMGKLWVLKKDSIVLQPVRKGLSDGQFVEVSGKNIKEGDTIVVGVSTVAKINVETQQRSPFMPGRPGTGTKK
jgi:HlyD family secretion protein